jgi:hypothetical protein
MADRAPEGGPQSCASPIDDLRLLAALDGNADPALLEHLRKCSFCSARARSFASLERTLRDRLFRALCPSSGDLLAFQQRTLSPERYIKIVEHIPDCPYCTRELALLSQLAMAAPVDGPRPHQRIVAELYAPRPLAFGQAFYGAQRSTTSSAHYVYRAGNMQLSVSVAQAFGRAGRVVVSGMLMLEGNLADLPPAGTASLLTAGMIVCSVPIDSAGCFALDDVPVGEHALSLRLHECEIVVESLVL